MALSAILPAKSGIPHEAMPRFRRQHEFLVAHAKQIVLAEQSRDAFVVDYEPLAVQLRRDSPVSVAAVSQGHSLNPVPQFRLGLAGIVSAELPIESCPAHLGRPAQRGDA